MDYILSFTIAFYTNEYTFPKFIVFRAPNALKAIFIFQLANRILSIYVEFCNTAYYE